jgi:hypothetical protein
MSEPDETKAETEKWLADREAERELKRDLLGGNEHRPKPWPVCLKCRMPVDPSDMHWLIPDYCDSHGVNRLERIVSRVARRHGRKLTLRLLKQLGN